MERIIYTAVLATVVWVAIDGKRWYDPHKMPAVLFRWVAFLVIGGILCNLEAPQSEEYYRFMYKGMFLWVAIRNSMFNFIWNPRNDLLYAKPGVWWDKGWYPIVWAVIVLVTLYLT